MRIMYKSLGNFCILFN